MLTLRIGQMQTIWFILDASKLKQDELQRLCCLLSIGCLCPLLLMFIEYVVCYLYLVFLNTSLVVVWNVHICCNANDLF